MFSYQGKITDTLGNPIPDSIYSLTFRLYTQLTGGSPFWNETQQVQVKNGLFSVLLGAVNPMESVPSFGTIYLSLQVGNQQELTPRLRIVSSPYSYLANRSAIADSALGTSRIGGFNLTDLDNRYVNENQTNSINSQMIVDNSILGQDLNQMGANINQVLKWSGTTWQPANDEVGSDNAWIRGTPDSVLYTIRPLGIARGGVNNMLYGNYCYTHTNLGVACTTGRNGQNDLYCTVCGGYRNRAESSFTTVGGGYGNTACGNYSTVGGGRDNRTIFDFVTIAGGDSNAGVNYSAVGGGKRNQAWVIAATIGGGYGNIAWGYYGVIGGGYQNGLGGVDCPTVGGGRNNFAGGGNFATVGGGYKNFILAYAATVAGGEADTVKANYGGILSGYSNLVEDTVAIVCGGYDNSATGKFSFVGGGYRNAANHWSTVGGGYNNTASGVGATIAGGNGDTAAANYSFAVGLHSIVPAGYSNSAAFNGQTATASNQLRCGVLSKTGGTFTIDHPIDPNNKILNHYFVEGPEMLNLYRGSVILDANGKAEVKLPDYFSTLNKNPHIQLTGVGTSDVYVLEDIKGNTFVIGGKPYTKVYWQVTG